MWVNTVNYITDYVVEIQFLKPRCVKSKLKETQLRIKVTLVAQAAWVSARTLCDITCQKL